MTPIFVKEIPTRNWPKNMQLSANNKAFCVYILLSSLIISRISIHFVSVACLICICKFLQNWSFFLPIHARYNYFVI